MQLQVQRSTERSAVVFAHGNRSGSATNRGRGRLILVERILTVPLVTDGQAVTSVTLGAIDYGSRNENQRIMFRRESPPRRRVMRLGECASYEAAM